MKKIWATVFLLLLTWSGLIACSNGNNAEASEDWSSDAQTEAVKEETNLSFSELEKMSEITVEGDVVTVALLQDIPLPYRWVVTYQSECTTLIEEYEVEEPANGSLFSAGSAPEYHVFVFELAESDAAELEFYNCWVVEPGNRNEANGKRKFILEYVDGNWFVQETEEKNEKKMFGIFDSSIFSIWPCRLSERNKDRCTGC
ncbi:MAG: hypothetical protein IJD26_02930, partial [Lachnospiraceae bacterium]|nr:hypothetical protein [Lachnospiraceae bacterium]